ncbi:MAG: potassium ABC transporter ATPase [Gemmatimonadota bacterium]
MLDLIYVGGTVVFFALMLLYVRACEALGADEKGEGKTR